MENAPRMKTPQWELRLRSAAQSMRQAESQVADFVQAHATELLPMHIADISRAAGVSDATVVRFCRRLGYQGLKEFKIALAQEPPLPSAEIAQEAIAWQDDAQALRTKVFLGGVKSLQDSLETLDIGELSRSVQALSRANNIDIYGVGGSAIIAAYFRHQLMKLGIRSNVYADAQALGMSMSQVSEGDVALGISCSGEAAEVVQALCWAGSQGATTICITNYARSSLAQQSQIRLLTTGGGFIGNDENSLSRIAQLAVVDTLYAGLAVEKGPDAMAKLASRNHQARNMERRETEDGATRNRHRGASVL